MRSDKAAVVKELTTTLASIEQVVDPEHLKERVRELEDKAADPSLWDDPAHAQQITSELSANQAKLRKLSDLSQRLDDIPVLYELADEEAAAGGDEAAMLAADDCGGR